MSFARHHLLPHAIVLLGVAAGAAAQSNIAVQPTAITPVSQSRATPYYGSSVNTFGIGELPGGAALTEPVLVIPDAQMEPDALDQVVEDLSIMSRIIQKNLSQDLTLGPVPLLGDLGTMSSVFVSTGKGAWAEAAGPQAVFSATGRVKPMYLGGYGALFFLRVGFPLLPPPETPEQPATTKKADPVWAEARRSLVEPDLGVTRDEQAGAAPQPYSRENLEALKAQLIASMRHAVNIQGVKPTEWLVFVVQGTARTAGDERPSRALSDAPAATADRYAKTVLTLRAKKADIDLYAADKLDRAQFEQRVQTVTY